MSHRNLNVLQNFATFTEVWQPSRSSEVLETTNREETTTACSLVKKPNSEPQQIGFHYWTFHEKLFFPPTVVKCHSRLQLWLIHFCDCCLPNQKSPHTYSDLAHSRETEFLAAPSLFFGSNTDFDSDEPITFSWLSPACCDFTLAPCSRYPGMFWQEVFFSRNNDKRPV